MPIMRMGPVMPALLLRGDRSPGRNPAAGRAGPRVDAQGRGQGRNRPRGPLTRAGQGRGDRGQEFRSSEFDNGGKRGILDY